MCSAAVRGGRLQRYLRVAGGLGPPRPHTLQLPELLQGFQPGQGEGGVSLQGWPQEEEAEEQAQALPSYVPLKTHPGVFFSPAELYSALFIDFQPDLMTSLMLRPWMLFAIGQSASTWQRTSRAWAMDTAWCSTARCVGTHTHTHTLVQMLASTRGFACLGDSQKNRGLWEGEGVVTLDP